MLKFKSKSAHDVLSDAKLSKEVAVPTEELAGDAPSVSLHPLFGELISAVK